jgi:hypothetical protein
MKFNSAQLEGLSRVCRLLSIASFCGLLYLCATVTNWTQKESNEICALIVSMLVFLYGSIRLLKNVEVAS